MKKAKKKPLVDGRRKLRNITDYIYDSIRHLNEHADFLLYLGRHKKDFFQKGTEYSHWVVISFVDVYSRNAIITINSIFDNDKRTSSFYTLVEYIKDEKIKARYSKRLSKLKLGVNALVRARAHQVAHFNTDINIYENGHFQINRPIQLDPRYIKRITKKAESFFWDIKEELSIEGLFVFSGGEPLGKSFHKLINKK